MADHASCRDGLADYLRNHSACHSIIVCENPKFVYMKPGRTGGTSILRGILEKRIKNIVHLKDRPVEFRHWMMTIDDEALKDYFIFTFARNPWDRVVSLAQYFHVSVAELLENAVNGCRTNTIWKHSLPVVLFSHLHGRQFVDFVGRFEHLQRDFNHVCRTIGIKPTRLPHLNVSDRRSDYSSYYDPETREHVAQTYRRDIEAFGYSFAESEKHLRILLLHHESQRRRLYVGPYLRAIGPLEQHGITLIPYAMRHVERALDYLNEPADLYLLSTQVLWPECLEEEKPVVVLELIDGAQLDVSRGYLDHPAVVGLIKSYSLRPAELHNRFRRRYHAQLLVQAGVQAPRSVVKHGPPKQLSEESLAKIAVGPGFGAHASMDRFRRTKFEWDANRPVDLHFVGTVRYRGSEIELHRRAALKAVQDYPGPATAAPGIPFCGTKYLKTLLMSKAVLSPWGWGQATLRDYEALFCGCVLVKPDSDHVKGWPDIFQGGKTYVPCRPDFADVHDLVAKISRDWEDYLPMRQLGRSMAVHGWRRQSVAARVAVILRDCWKRVEAAR